MKKARQQRIWQTTSRRQLDLAVLLENVHDPHNISAVLRSCDSVGVADVYVLYSDPQLKKQNLSLGKRSSSGARKWIRVHFFREPEACFHTIKTRYEHILASEIHPEADSLYSLDLTASSILLFGNEHEGLSKEARKIANGTFYIPQEGMVKSLNISVACAVSLYEAFRQREKIGYYDRSFESFEGDRKGLYELYIERHKNKISGKRHLGFKP